tara:strand:+ start:203 stop:349 length:147 start_codon:yes stop_codon:yes gene_type:complete
MLGKILGVMDIFIALVLLLSLSNVNVPTTLMFFMFFYLAIKGGFSLVG